MITMDVFQGDAFSAQSLTAAVDKIGFQPSLLSSIQGLFDPTPVRTEAVWIESRGSEAALIQTSNRGTPRAQRADTAREARPFKTKRLAKGSRITASELLGIGAFGSETELKQVSDEVARRQYLLRIDHDLTIENLKLSTIMGTTLDADGTTIYAWATEFGQTIPAEVDFDLDAASPASGVLQTACSKAVRSIMRGLKGMGGGGVRIIGLAGDNFTDNFLGHSEYRSTYQNQSDAAGGTLRLSGAFREWDFGGIHFVNYRGTDDDSTVTVGTDKCKFFPVGAGIFKWAMSPGESLDNVSSIGQPFYSRIVPDDDRNEYADVELDAYILPVCTMPQALYRAKRT